MAEHHNIGTQALTQTTWNRTITRNFFLKNTFFTNCNHFLAFLLLRSCRHRPLHVLLFTFAHSTANSWGNYVCTLVQPEFHGNVPVFYVMKFLIWRNYRAYPFRKSHSLYKILRELLIPTNRKRTMLKVCQPAAGRLLWIIWIWSLRSSCLVCVRTSHGRLTFPEVEIYLVKQKVAINSKR